MAITNILQGAQITVSATPQKLFTTNSQNRLSYRIFVPRTKMNFVKEQGALVVAQW